MTTVFFDTWAYLALANPADAGHHAAVAASEWIEENAWIVVTSDYVLDEAITGLHCAGGAGPATSFLDDFEAEVAAGQVVVLSIDAGRRLRAARWFRRLAPDTPRLSFTDCSSFALLEELEIATAFTADRHFAKVKGVHRMIQLEQGRFVFRASP